MKKKYADMDPLEEIRAIREEISGEFASLRELGAYLREKALCSREQPAGQKARKTMKKAVSRRKTGKQTVHA